MRYPFATREAAQQYVERELAGEAQAMASGNVALSARARTIRETDAELWAKFVEIEEEFACENEDTREAVHRAAGTFIVMIRLVLADLEADGEICRTGIQRATQRWHLTCHALLLTRAKRWGEYYLPLFGGHC